MTIRNRMLIAAAVLAGLVVLAGCTATDTMWYDTTPAYSSGAVYYRPGTTTPYYYYDTPYDYGPSYYYYDPYPYGFYNFGFNFREGGGHHERFEHHGGGHHR